MHGSTPKKIQKLHFNCNNAIKKTNKHDWKKLKCQQ